MEELVAELGAAFVCADLPLTPQPRAEHAAYIASWLKALKDRQAGDLLRRRPRAARRRLSSGLQLKQDLSPVALAQGEERAAA